ncbi:VWA domain-containing protein [Pelagibius sp. Alg239-R121]|uniref:VWA domain-containing protein n=1 Tax=Pelagibius sp. Alg239-R121 TaxID=2993448 RepID=UPI0024A769B1|nr:VWA domain-containing protein [Pelagibius sp. Alg239-R121]
MFDFATPLAFLLLPLPILAVRLLPPLSGASGAISVPTSIAVDLGQTGSAGLAVAGRKLLPIILWVALVVAIAGPRLVVQSPALPASDRDIVLALDLSGSMERKDFELDGEPARRLDTVKRVAVDFVRGRAGDRVGLVIFSEKAFFATPLTYDVEAVAHSVEEATIGIAGRSTAISDGLGLALKRLEASASKSRVVILLSDGVNTSGNVEPKDAATLAKDLGIRVHTIAMGLHATTDEGHNRDAVDAETLQAVAELSGGTSFRVRTTADLEAVGRSIDMMESNRNVAPATQIYRDFWIYPAGLAFLLALALVFTGRRQA